MSRTPMHHRSFPTLLFLFFFSGCAALIYEVVWLQMLELVIGSSGVSLGVLLGAFMGGMCLGSLLLPRWVSPEWHPLKTYALLELGIGICGILVLYGIPILADLYVRIPSHGVLTRALIASVCLLIPASLMGATLPIASRFIESTPEGFSWMGLLYGSNIVGSVMGCLIAGFYLLRLHDMPTATFVAAVLNTLIACAAFLCAARSRYQPAPSSTLQPEGIPLPHRGLIYLVVALSGMSALGAEVVWTRLLSLLLGATVYTFAIILAVFLAGLGMGSYAGSFLARVSKHPAFSLGLCQMFLAGAIAWAAFMISRSLPFWPINPGLYTNEWGAWHMFQLDLLRTAWVVLPAAILWGASFPLAIAATGAGAKDMGRLVGILYACNTLGAITGSLGFSLVLIPHFGTGTSQRFLILTAAVTAVLTMVAHLKINRAENPRRIWVSGLSFSRAYWTLATLLIAVFLATTVSEIPWMMVAWGRYCATYVAQAEPRIVKDEAQIRRNEGSHRWFCTYVGEGMNVSVAVTKTVSGNRFFHGAGKVQASTQPQDMRLQRMLGHLSALTCKKPDQIEDVLVVACGAGVTAGTFIPYPGIKRIVICDIEPLVPKVVAPMFSKENYGIADGIARVNPHMVKGKEVTVVYDDGRHYVRTLPDDARFDIITSDPIDPWVKGSAALNTIEYYEMCKRHLKPGGVMSLWMPLYESNLASARSMIATFFQVFPNGMLFSNDELLEGYDAVLIGQAEASAIDLDLVAQLLRRNDYENVRASLHEVGFGSQASGSVPPELATSISLFSTFAAHAPALLPWTANAQINRDNNLRLQYLAGISLNSYLGTAILQNILSYYQFPAGIFKGSPKNLELLKDELQSRGRIAQSSKGRR